MTDYKLVPLEPTPEMLNEPLQGGRFENRVDLRPSIYRAMLAAAHAAQRWSVAWMTTARVLGEGITTDKRHGEKWMKSHPSKTTPLYAAPQPAEQQPAPDVSALVEALERIARHPRTRGDELGYAGCRNIAKEALAAHRQQEADHDNQ